MASTYFPSTRAADTREVRLVSAISPLAAGNPYLIGVVRVIFLPAVFMPVVHACLNPHTAVRKFRQALA